MKPSEMVIGKLYQCDAEDGWNPVVHRCHDRSIFSTHREWRECCEHGRGMDETCTNGMCNRIFGISQAGKVLKMRDMSKALKEAMPLDDAATFCGYSVAKYWRPIHLLLREHDIATAEQLRERLDDDPMHRRERIREWREAAIDAQRERDELRAEVKLLQASLEQAHWMANERFVKPADNASRLLPVQRGAIVRCQGDWEE